MMFLVLKQKPAKNEIDEFVTYLIDEYKTRGNALMNGIEFVNKCFLFLTNMQTKMPNLF